MPYRNYITRRRSILVSLFLTLVASCVLAQGAVHPDPTSRNIQHSSSPRAPHTITNLREAHGLSAEEARLSYPIHVRAVVTYFDAPSGNYHGGVFLNDATGGMYAFIPADFVWLHGAPQPGTLIDISGVSSPGQFAPIIDQAHIRILAASHLPLHATPVTLSHLLTGTDDCRWVEIEGVVRNITESATHVTLHVAMADGILGATSAKQPGVDYTRLLDATVKIRGSAGALFNSAQQMIGSRLYFAGAQSWTIVEPGHPDILTQTLRPLSSLSRFTPTLAWQHRVHVRGTVTLFWPGRKICIEDDTQGLCAQTSQTTPLAVGSSADLAGFTIFAGFRPSLDAAVFKASPDTHTIAIAAITSQDAIKGDHDSEPVTIEGRLIGRDIEAHDTTLVLESGKSIFRAILPKALDNSYLSTIPIGSKLRLTGICSVEFDTYGTLLSFTGLQASRFWILLRSPKDVVVLQTPPWLTANRLTFLLLLALAITVVVAVWVLVLKRRVEQKTRELRESRELYRHMALHDTLTGLPTRALLHDHLKVGLERSKRFKKSLALLMLDLDNFKQINDSFGHESGDQVLRITAERLSTIIRKTDSVARMGGDEFIVLLNDLDDPAQAELVAEKIVATLSLPVRFGALEISVSVSVGVCTLSDDAIDARSLLKRVDSAMYRAKARGRGCFQVFTDDLIATPNGQPSAPASSNAALNDQPETHLNSVRL